MIIGITGLFASGKGEAAEYLHRKYGFVKRGYGDEIRKELTSLGLPLGRDAEYHRANEQRQKLGFGYWSKKILESVEPGENTVVEGIRNPGELTELAAAGNFALIAVDAPIETRFARMEGRLRAGDPQTLEELRIKETRELHNDDPIKQSIGDCIARADYVVQNDKDREYFYHQLDEIVTKLLKQDKK